MALATPASAKRAQAVRIQAQINVLADKAEIATEDWNQAKIEYDGLHAKVVALTARLAANTVKTDILQTSLDVRADSMYRSGPLGLLDVLFGAASFEDFATTWDLLNEMNKQESEAVAQLKVLRAEALAAQADLKPAEDGGQEGLRRHGRSPFLHPARRGGGQGPAQGRRARDRRAERRRPGAPCARTRTPRGRRRGHRLELGQSPIAPRAGVVGIALRYLGHRYVWGASGPQTFDCSGFTMFVYAQVGVRLPHYSGAQINGGARVSRANLQPGDLVFFGSPIHHVGIYIGGGKMVHAPHTGDVVSIDPIDGRGFVGGCRP